MKRILHKIIAFTIIGIFLPVVALQSDDGSRYSVRSAVPEDLTLAETMHTISAGVGWGAAVYAGVLFGYKTKTDLEALIDNYAASHDWLNVLLWTAACKKLGIEREEAIKSALDGLPMVGPLPWTQVYNGIDYFCVERKFALLGYSYAEKYNYRLDKWNKTNAYNFFKLAVENARSPVLFVDANGSTWSIGYGPRYYDESACTFQCFLVFYEMGIADGLVEALNWWSWINSNLWYQNTHYKYALNWPDYECEAGFFAKIVANLKYYHNDLGDWSRVLVDLQNRFLIGRWNSAQWSDAEGAAYAVVHHYPFNRERRLAATIGAWTTLLSFYEQLDSACRTAVHDVLVGYDGLDPAWKLLMSPTAALYENSTGKFKWASDSPFSSDDATAYALSLMFFMGMVPKTATPAFPIEEFGYEYLYDIDPELFGIDLDNCSIRISVVNAGEMEFIYGNSPVLCSFPSSGVYKIAFSNDWNTVTYVSKLQDLPTNRKFLWAFSQQHSIEVVQVTPLESIVTRGSILPIAVAVQNKGIYSETFNVTVYANSTAIQSQTVTLESGSSQIIPFVWEVTGVSEGEYTLLAEADAVPGEVDTNDNARQADSVVTVVIPGHDVAVKNITTEVRAIDVALKNYGNETETFSFTVYANSASILTQDATLQSGLSRTFSFAWNTSGVVEGNYSISAYAWPVAGETNLENNMLHGEWVIILKGDVDGNGLVDLLDAVRFSRAFDSKPGDENWNLNADMNDDGTVDIFDALIVSGNYGRSL